MAKKNIKSIKPLDLLGDLKAAYNEGTREKLAPVYIIYGEEVFIRERAILRLKQIINKLKGSIERVSFDSKIDITDWTNGLYDLPMFNPIRLIIAGEFSDLKNEQVEFLLEYLKNPSPDVILLLLSYKIDKRKTRLLSILEHGLVCEAKHPKTEDLAMWIKGFAGERGKTIEPQAIEFLKERYESDLARIEKELEKTSLYLGERTVIKKENIEFTSTGVSSCSIFDLSPVLASKNKKMLLERLQKLLNAGEHPILINSTLMNRIKKLLLGYDVLSSGGSDSELSKEVGVPVFYLASFKSELKNYKKEQLIKMYRRCMNIDSELKRARRPSEEILVSGIMNLIERR
jgi:DNA polymerase III subunit delta